MDVTIAIATYDAREELQKCLQSIEEHRGSSAVEIVVCDNASNDGSASMVAERFPRALLLRSEENLGFAAASNRCWKEARAPLVLFLNPDAVLTPGALPKMVEMMKERKEVGALGPRLRYPDGAIQMSYGKMLGLTAELVQKCWNAGYARGKGPLAGAVEKAYSREHYVDWVSGACLLTRRDLLETVNGFDENFFLYSEDVDLCARIRGTGARILFTPEAEVVHLQGRSTAADRERALFESRKSRLYFYEKHLSPFQVGVLKLYMAMKSACRWTRSPVPAPKGNARRRNGEPA